MAEIRLERLSKTYAGGKAPAVRDVSLVVRHKEVMVLLGPSGCGKTTLLRMIAGLEYPDAGSVLIDGRDVTELPPRKRGIAMVFQSYAVFPHLTVFENIAFGLRMLRRPKSRSRRWSGCGSNLSTLPGTPAQAPATNNCVRAHRMEPAVPHGRLQSRASPSAFRASIVRCVPSSLSVGPGLGDRLAVMRDGQIEQVGEPVPVYDRPATSFVGSFSATRR